MKKSAPGLSRRKISPKEDVAVPEIPIYTTVAAVSPVDTAAVSEYSDVIMDRMTSHILTQQEKPRPILSSC